MKKVEEPPSNFLVLVSDNLAKISKKSLAVRKQFYPSKEELKCSGGSFIDPLLEDNYLKTKGLIHKYGKRVLIILTMKCAAYCRFCTRRRIVGDIDKGNLSTKDVDRMMKYIENNNINEVIFSGGDPVMAGDLLIYGLNEITKVKCVKIVRIHTRTAVSEPKLMTKKLLGVIKKLNDKKTVYISVHFEHPDEITKITLDKIKELRKTGSILLSQSVFLKGVNDSVEVLEDLFTRLVEIGVKPYYIFRCDLVKGAEHFIVPFEKEIKIMTELRKKLSGLAYPTYVIDTPNGTGKIPVPLDFWKFDKSEFKDFEGKKVLAY